MAGEVTPEAGDVVEEGVAERVAALRDENAQLRQAVRSHAVVDQAIGVVIALGRLTPEQGWGVLREISQRTNTKLREVAALIVDWARTGHLDDDVRGRLEEQLGRVRPAREPGRDRHADHRAPGPPVLPFATVSAETGRGGGANPGAGPGAAARP